jgi:hypothetical protein
MRGWRPFRRLNEEDNVAAERPPNDHRPPHDHRPPNDHGATDPKLTPPSPPGPPGAPGAPGAPTPPRSFFLRPQTWLIGGVALAVVSLAAWAVIAITPSHTDSASNDAAAGTGASGGPGGSSASPGASAGASASASAGPSATPKPTGSSNHPGIPGPPIGGPWPNPNNTGVPAGTSLSSYTGPCTITAANTVIDAKTISCDLDVRAANVTIKRSRITGIVLVDTDAAGSSAWSLTLADSTVSVGLRQIAAVSYGNMTVLRSDISGGVTSVQCGEHAINCTVQDSYLHGQLIPADANWHLGGFLSNGGHNIRLRHNTIICDAPANNIGEGCSGDLNLFGDFAQIADVVADSNFLGASVGMAMCLNGGDSSSKAYPHATGVVVTNNIFARGTNGKCGDYGPVAGFNVSGPGNVWSNNNWDKGGAVAPDM